MDKKKKGRFGAGNFLGIPLDPTFGVGDKVLDHIDDSIDAEKRREAASKYWMRCPSCGKRVVRKELIKKGCYVCGWQGTEADLEIAEAKSVSQPGKVSNPDKKTSRNSYRTNCPKCGAKVITERLQETGCYICGWKERE